MIEEFRTTAIALDVGATCDHCGESCKSQIYSVTLERPKVTREWIFDTLECLRGWAKPV